MRRLWLACVAPLTLWCASDVPQWVRAAAAKAHPAYQAKTPAVVLLNEETLTVDAEGKRVFQERYVAKRLTAGRVRLSGGRTYDSRTGRIRDFRAWVINPNGNEIKYGKDKIAESTASSSGGYSEQKYREVAPGDELLQGGVFAYEIVEEEKTVFTQHVFAFQESFPVVEGRFVLNLPPGWETNGRLFNTADKPPAVSGNTYTWEVANLPWIEREIHMPGRHLIAPRLGITYFPSDNRAGLRPLKDWAAVSNWLTDLTGWQAELTPALEAKAAQLTANAKTEIEKVRAIAGFVQQTAYVSINLNITRGGGYVPHAADTVQARNYGDCKDKSNLMKALLKAAGIESHLVTIFSGSREYVRPEWPSTMQFNHAIVAVKVSEPSLPSVLPHPALGNLLFFDPTDPYTPVGDIDDDEQGSYALVIAADKGALVQVPVVAASANRTDMTAEGVMNAEGGINAKIRYQHFGQTAAPLRAAMRSSDAADLKKMFEAIFTRRMGGLKLKSVQPADAAKEGRLQLELELEALQFGRILQSRLLILTPGTLATGHGYSLPAKPRTAPVKIKARRFSDHVTIETPPGFKPDEIPASVAMRSAYGDYKAEWKMDGTRVVFTQALESN
ncbi:MAG: DUF3857 domain-containing protein, partial [Acidobacteria bacterium]|nr:DUF3857 domain-containing protein [Acidobacteriota bacterium]